MATKQRESSRNEIFGMMSSTVGALLLCSGGALAQFERGSMAQLVFLRFSTQSILSIIWWIFNKPKQCIEDNIAWYGEKRYRLNIWIRGFLYYWFIFLLWRGFNYIPFGDGIAMEFTSPISVVIAARIFLKEELSKYFIITLISCLIGLIFLAQPEIIFVNIRDRDEYKTADYRGIILIFTAVLCTTMVKLLTRTAKNVHFIQIELVSSIQTFLWTPIIILFCKYILNDMSVIGGKWSFDIQYNLIGIAMGFLGFGGVLFMIISYQLGEATKIAWFEYLQVIIAFIYQSLLFHDLPNLWEYIGSLLIMFGISLPLIEQIFIYKNNINTLKPIKSTDSFMESTENEQDEVSLMLDDVN